MKIKYRIGDATAPQTNGEPNAILHICNDMGGWGRGFVLALSSRWPIEKGVSSPEACYREWFKKKWKNKHFVLGQIQPVWVENKTWVINMIAQRDYKDLVEEGVVLDIPNVNYTSLRECLERVKIWMSKDTSLHMPRIGAGLGKGNWNTIEKIINMVFQDTPNEIYVYDYQKP